MVLDKFKPWRICWSLPESLPFLSASWEYMLPIGNQELCWSRYRTTLLEFPCWTHAHQYWNIILSSRISMCIFDDARVYQGKFLHSMSLKVWRELFNMTYFLVRGHFGHHRPGRNGSRNCLGRGQTETPPQYRHWIRASRCQLWLRDDHTGRQQPPRRHTISNLQQQYLTTHDFC